jgi:hypothetical protein
MMAKALIRSAGSGFSVEHIKTCCIITIMDAMTRNLDEHLTKLRELLPVLKEDYHVNTLEITC